MSGRVGYAEWLSPWAFLWDGSDLGKRDDVCEHAVYKLWNVADVTGGDDTGDGDDTKRQTSKVGLGLQRWPSWPHPNAGSFLQYSYKIATQSEPF